MNAVTAGLCFQLLGHQLAAIWSFSNPAPSGRAGSGYRVMELMPYAKLSGLDLNWNAVGCDELALLNLSDRKLMRTVWGEPRTHTTAHRLHQEVFEKELQRIDRAEARLRRESVERSMAQFDELQIARSSRKPGILATLWERLQRNW